MYKSAKIISIIAVVVSWLGGTIFYFRAAPLNEVLREFNQQQGTIYIFTPFAVGLLSLGYWFLLRSWERNGKVFQHSRAISIFFLLLSIILITHILPLLMVIPIYNIGSTIQ